MAQWTDVSRILRGATEASRRGGKRQWRVKDKLVAWERPLRPADLEELGDAAPDGPILGVRVPLEVKEAMLASKPRVYFTTSHFNGYPAILVRLPKIGARELATLLGNAVRERSAKRK